MTTQVRNPVVSSALHTPPPPSTVLNIGLDKETSSTREKNLTQVHEASSLRKGQSLSCMSVKD